MNVYMYVYAWVCVDGLHYNIVPGYCDGAGSRCSC